MNKEIIELFIDASTTNCGICILNTKSEVLLDHISFKTIKRPKGMSRNDYLIIKLIIIKSYFDDLSSKFKIKRVLIEGIYSTSYNQSTEVLNKLHGFLLGYFIKIPVKYIPPKTIKKLVTDNGNADKNTVKEILETTYKYKFQDEDQSDAFALMIADKGFMEIRGISQLEK